MQQLTIIKKIILYFPARLLISAAFFSYILIDNYSNILALENKILLGVLQFFGVPSFLADGLYIGSSYGAVLYEPPIHIQLIFLIFFAAFAVSTASSFEKRKNIMFFGTLSFIGFIISQSLVIVTMHALGIGSYDRLFVINLIITTFIGASCIEACFLISITKPPKIKIKSPLKRSYFTEFAYFGVMLTISSFLVYYVASIAQLQGQSIVTTYLAINITTIFVLRHFLAYFFIQVKMPDWLRPQKRYDSTGYSNTTSLTFLLPAYNEQSIIARTIESIDKAAAHYLGKTEILVVNDGSKDKTEEIATEKMRSLKHATGKIFTIPNSGKGFALRYGAQRSSGDIIFRIDTDSIIDEYSIDPIMNHFKDPRVGSVSGNPFVLEDKTLWQKLRELQVFSYIFAKMEQELVDTIMVQPGAFSVFRKDALLKAGGWADDMYGEDAELTIRLGRSGYKHDFEPRAFVRTDTPSTLEGTREQRLRWAMGYYGVRGRNWDLMRELKGPRSIMFLLAMYSHGMNLVHTVFWSYLIIGIIAEFLHPNLVHLIGLAEITTLIKIHFLLHGMQYGVYLYYLCKDKKYYLIPYIPLMRLYGIIIGGFVAPEAIELLLIWSSKWKQNNFKSYTALRQILKHRVRFS
ncbi:Glycosyltransferase AglD [uncultured archaeon]|nr:Glycosyltransferase AglD [uncultured archaeon]